MCLLVCLFTTLVAFTPIFHPIARTYAQADTAAQAMGQLNRTRLENGLPPLSISGLLERAAQSHSDDQQRGNFLDDTGSDGSTGKDRVLRAGYTTWQGGRMIWGETLYVSTGGFAETLDFILNDPSQRASLLNTHFREMGLGVAGTDRQYWTIIYAAQPNVLPAFINDGAEVTNNANVAVRLTQEEALPEGEGKVTLGRAVEVRLSTESTMRGVAWQLWQPLLEFKFDLKPGPKTVYVQYRDAAGRTVINAASIRYDPNAATLIQPVGPGAAQTQAPPALPSITPEPTSTAIVSPTPAATPRPGAPVPTPTAVAIGNSPPTKAPPTRAVALVVPSPSPSPAAYVYSVNNTQTLTESASTTLTNSTTSVTAPNAITQDPPAEPTPVRPYSLETIQQSLASPLLGWLLPLYGVVQVLLLVAALAFFTRKTKP